MAVNTAALDTRIKATAAMTMYDMTRVNANGYFDSEDSEEARYQKKAAMCAQRLEDLKAGEYKLGGGVVDPLPEDESYEAITVKPEGSNRYYIQSALRLNKQDHDISFLICDFAVDQPRVVCPLNRH